MKFEMDVHWKDLGFVLIFVLSVCVSCAASSRHGIIVIDYIEKNLDVIDYTEKNLDVIDYIELALREPHL